MLWGRLALRRLSLKYSHYLIIQIYNRQKIIGMISEVVGYTMYATYLRF